MRRPLSARERVTWWAVVVGVVALSASTVRLLWIDDTLDAGDLLVVLAILVVVEVGFAATGLMLWRLRPNSPAGALIAAAALVSALVTVASNVSYTDSPLAGTAAVDWDTVAALAAGDGGIAPLTQQ
jgi:hypothetical protein